MKHYVYELIFEERKRNNIKPYKYIGSKNKTIFENGILLGRNKPYYGSPKWGGYDQILEKEKPKVVILHELDYNASHTELLELEKKEQLKMSVVSNPDYFNLSIATTKSNYTNPDYASYKHITTGKTVRLRRDHKMVKSGEYVGVSKNTKLPLEVKQRIGRKGKLNPFYGRTHSKDTKKLIGNKNRNRIPSKETRLKMSKSAKGKTKTEEHRRKIGRKGMTTLKNIHTDECIRIPLIEKNLYNLNIWKHPLTIASTNNSIEQITCPYCNKTMNIGGNYNRWHGDKCKLKNENN